MGLIDNIISNLAAGIHKKRKEEEEQERQIQQNRRVFSSEEFKPQPDFDESRLAPSAQLPNDTVTRQQQRQSLDSIDRVSKFTNENIIGTPQILDDAFDKVSEPVTRTVEEARKLARRAGVTQMMDRIGQIEDTKSPFGAIGRLTRGKNFTYGEEANFVKDTAVATLRSVPRGIQSLKQTAIDKDEYKPESNYEKFLYGEEPIKSIQQQSEDIENFEKKYGVPDELAAATALPLAAGLTITDAIPVTPGKQGVKQVSKEALEEMSERILKESTEKITKDQAIELAKKALQSVDDVSTLRPFKTTSMAGADLPDSEVARTLSPSTTTVNFSPSNKYTPDISSGRIAQSPSFLAKYKSTTAEEPYLKEVLGAAAGDRPFTTNLKDPNTAASKILRKLKTKPDYSEDSIGDFLRGNIVARDSSDAKNILTQLEQNVNIESIDDFISNPNQWGYQGINLNIRTPQGNLAEIQIHTPSSEAVQKALHPLYEKWRDADEVPLSVFEEARKIADDVRLKFENKADDLPFMKPDQSAEDATALWENEYLPRMNELLEQSKSASDDQLPFYKEQIENLEKEFSNRVDDLQTGNKERKFITSVKEEETIDPAIRESVEGQYKPRANEELLKTAQARIDQDEAGAIEHVLYSDSADDETVAMGVDLVRRLQNRGDYGRAVDVVEGLAAKLTEAGRTVQAASLLGRLSPEGALLKVQREINKVNKARNTKIKLSPESAEKIKDLAKVANETPEGPRKVRAAAKLAERMQAEIPSTIGEKLSTVQTIAQLLNPKTIIRNAIGNFGFATLENVKDVVATPIDFAAGLATGQRYKSFPNPVTQAKAFGKGFVKGGKEAFQGIDTTAAKTQYDLSKKRAFRTKETDNIIKKSIYKPVDFLDRVMRATLKSFDEGFYKAAREDSLRQMMKVNKVTEPTEEMEKLAHLDGLKRTFQDDSLAAEAFGRIKSGLNVGKSFGVGDLVLKYPKTPGNLLARGIEYSPIGFFSSAIDLGKMILGRTNSQKEFVESTARAVTGTTAMVATGALLHQMGIISGKSDIDNDIKELERTQGFGDYRINASALMRFISSGFDKDEAKKQEGDTILSYDWFQPQAINFAMGADIDANQGVNPKSLVGTLIGALSSSANTLVEQPLVSGVNRLFNYGDLPGGVAQTFAGAASSFTPSLLNQVKQLIDNTSRDPQDPDLAKKGVNLVENRIPFLNENLPPAYDVLGDQKETYQNDSNNFFNVLFNPAFVSEIETTPEGDEVLRLFEETGESTQAPRKIGNSISVNGVTKQLTGEEKARLQQYVGTKTELVFQKIMSNPKYQQLDDDEKVKVLSNAVTDVMMAGKIEILGHRPKTVPRKNKVKNIMELEDPELPFMTP